MVAECNKNFFFCSLLNFWTKIVAYKFIVSKNKMPRTVCENLPIQKSILHSILLHSYKKKFSTFFSSFFSLHRYIRNIENSKSCTNIQSKISATNFLFTQFFCIIISNNSSVGVILWNEGRCIPTYYPRGNSLALILKNPCGLAHKFFQRKSILYYNYPVFERKEGISFHPVQINWQICFSRFNMSKW